MAPCPFASQREPSAEHGGVSIIVPTFRRPDALARLLESARRLHYPFVETVVVNCAGEPLELRDDAHAGERVAFIDTEKESLPSHARNIGARASSGRFLFFLDDDNVVGPETVCWLVAAMSADSMLGLAAPVVMYLAAPDLVWSAGARRNRLSSITRFPGRGSSLGELGQHGVGSLEDFPDAYVVSRSVFAEVGGYDERHFPIHYEESDLCRRVKDAGYRLRTVLEAAVWHDVVPPGSSGDRARLHHVHTPERAFYSGRNRILFMFLHERGAFPAFLLLFLAPLTAYYLVVSGSNERSAGPTARAYLRGVHEGIRFTYGHQR